MGTESALSPISVSDIVADNGYNAQFLTLLANYGAVGSGSGNTDNGLGNANSVLNITIPIYPQLSHQHLK